MREITLRFDGIRPAVFVTAKVVPNQAAHGLSVELVHVVLATPEDTPSKQRIRLSAFVRDLGETGWHALMTRFQMEGAPHLERCDPTQAQEDICYFGNRVFAAVCVPKEYLDAQSE